MVLVTAIAWTLGVVSYPYAGGIFEFLRLQIFGSGLSPDIEVGREWKPYSDAWFLVTMAAPLLATWVAALLLRLRMGPRLTAEDMTLMVLQFLFLMLTFKARRFIEYWPPIGLLSAAYLAAPPLSEIVGSVRGWATQRLDARAPWVGGAGIAALALVCSLAWHRVDAAGDASLLLANWPIWAAPLTLLALPALVRSWATPGAGGSTLRMGRLVAVLAGGGLLLSAVGLAIWWTSGGSPGHCWWWPTGSSRWPPFGPGLSP
jgi:hypothetical protein